MANKPENCYIWGERDDVDVFYQACDFFLFPSKFELNPLVVKEALSWDLPVMMYRLDTYMGKYDTFDNVYYMSQDFNENCEIITKVIKDSIYKKPGTLKPIDKSKEIAVILTHADTDDKKALLKKSLLAIKDQGFPIIVSSHIQVDEEIYDLADYVVYDKENPVIHRDEYNKHNSYLVYTFNHPWAEMSYQMLYNHGYAAIKLMKNASSIAEINGYQKIHFVNYDYVINDHSVLENHSRLLDSYNVVSYRWGQDNRTINTGFFSTYTHQINKVFAKVNSKQDYCEIGKHVCEQNVYELCDRVNMKIYNMDINTIKDKNIVNKVGVKVFPLYDVFEDTEYESNSTFIYAFLCKDKEGKKYMNIHPSEIKEPVSVKLESGDKKIEFTLSDMMPYLISIEDEQVKDTITLSINGKVFDVIDEKTQMGTINIKNRDILKSF
jgi:hypothetical protein